MVGRAWLIGDRLAVPDIVRWVEAAHSPNFAADGSGFRAGDFLVGGLDVGLGSGDLRAATVTLRRLGVGALIARSFDQAFYQAAIERGLPALVIEEVEAIKLGDRLRVDIEGTDRQSEFGRPASFVICMTEQLDVLRAGGLGPYRICKHAAEAHINNLTAVLIKHIASSDRCSSASIPSAVTA
jgi:3-isopropylmalate dehydratase small subunit